MKKLLSVKSENPNYVAKVFALPALRKHPNADKLALVTVDGNTVITGIGAKEGELYIYFPLECTINKEYLKYSNSFSDANLNVNSCVKGFFNEHGRVRAVKLRGQPSEGYIIPITSIIEWLELDEDQEAEFKPGVEFDHIGDIKLCEKYVNTRALQAAQNAERALQKKHGRVKRTSKLVDDQFRFHIDTKHLKREMYNVKPDDIITVSYKMHGASAIVSNILCKKQLKWYDKLFKFFGANVIETHYDIVYASRKVIKNQYAEDDTNKQHYYDTDIWKVAADRLKPALTEGITVYMELVGQTPTGSWIQKPYDYGTKPMEMEIYVYRVTSTNASGKVIEFTTPQVTRFCEKFGLKRAPVIYYGVAKNLFPDIDVTNHWQDNVLERLKKLYNEKDCYMCVNKVPEEGIVLSIEKDYFEAYKLKSFRFLEHETAELDKGEVNIEDTQST